MKTGRVAAINLLHDGIVKPPLDPTSVQVSEVAAPKEDTQLTSTTPMPSEPEQLIDEAG